MKPCPVHLEISQTWDGKPTAKADTIRLKLGVSGTDLTIDVDAPFYDDPRPSGPPGPTDGLWNYEVVEIFIAGVGPEYLEIELGPHGHHLVLQLADIRTPQATLLPIEFEAEVQGSRWRGHAKVPHRLLPTGPHRLNATAIHGPATARHYLSVCPLPGPSADFHQPEQFTVTAELI